MPISTRIITAWCLSCLIYLQEVTTLTDKLKRKNKTYLQAIYAKKNEQNNTQLLQITRVHKYIYLYMSICLITWYSVVIIIALRQNKVYPQCRYQLYLHNLQAEEKLQRQAQEISNNKEKTLLESMTWEQIMFVVNLTVKDEMQKLQVHFNSNNH